MVRSRFLAYACAIAVMTLFVGGDVAPTQAPDVIFDVSTDHGGDTLFVNMPGTIIFSIDAAGYELVGVTWPVIWRFTNGNIIGWFSHVTGEVIPSDAAVAAFEAFVFDPGIGSDPDSSVTGFLDFDGTGFQGFGPLWSLTFTPSDTGLIIVDSTIGRIGPTLGWPRASDLDSGELPGVYVTDTIYVTSCPVLMGDANNDGVVTASDLIYMVNYIFKSGPDPLPMRTVGDANCSGGLGGSDIIYLVNYMFKSGTPPCACYVSII